MTALKIGTSIIEGVFQNLRNTGDADFLLIIEGPQNSWQKIIRASAHDTLALKTIFTQKAAARISTAYDVSKPFEEAEIAPKSLPVAIRGVRAAVYEPQRRAKRDLWKTFGLDK